METLWRVRLLGELRVERAGPEGSAASTGDELRFPTRKTAALLAYLAFHRGRDQPREAVVDLLWPESEREAGRNSLNVALSSLRRLLEPREEPRPIAPGAVVWSDRRSVALQATAVSTDVGEFEAALREAKSSLPVEHQAQWLRAALELYGGPLLPTWYEEWIAPERRRLSELRLEALSQLAAICRDRKRLDEAIALARDAVAADPLREETRRDLMRYYAEADQAPAALREYQDLDRRLREELAVGPSAETVALAAALRQDGGAVADAPAPMPMHRIGGGLPLPLTRFIGRDAEIRELLALLAPACSREGDVHLALIPPAPREDAPRPAAAPRLVTLTGPGGCGKTRLALALAERLRGAQNASVWLVPLGHVTDSEQMGEEIRQAMRLPDAPGSDSVGQIARALAQAGRGCSLLVLDNFEQLLVSAANESGGADWVRSLLDRSPDVVCLVTSRQRLGLTGEREFPVGPLPVPEDDIGCLASRAGRATPADKPASAVPIATASVQRSTPDALLNCPSVELFVDRAQAARPGFRLSGTNSAAVAQLCSWLEGLPLAIELAAARAAVMTPAEILAHLMAGPERADGESRRLEFLVSRQRDLPARHQTLRATLEWSYRLLSPELQRFFAALSVFRGGWTLEAAEAVCGADGEPKGAGTAPPSSATPRAPHSTLDALEQLRDCSLIIAEETPQGIRFRMLETLREFAAGHLAPGARARLRERHLEWYLGLAEQAERHLQGPEQARWLDLLETVYDNLRAALAWCLAERDGERGEAALRLSGALWGFWLTRGYLAEGRDWLERALGVAEEPLPGPQRVGLRAKALIGAGNIAKYQGEYERAASLYREAMAEAREGNDRLNEAYALSGLGMLAGDRGEAAAARAFLNEALSAFRALDHPQGIASTLNNLGNAACRAADFAAASALYEEGLSVLRVLGDRHGIAVTLNNLGLVARYQGDATLARTRHEEALALHRDLGNQGGAGYSLNGLGLVAVDRGELTRARAHLEEGLAVFRQLGHQRGVAYALNNLGRVGLAAGDVAAARACLEEALSLFRAVGEQEGLGHALNNLAALFTRTGDLELARIHYRQGLSLFHSQGNQRGVIHALDGTASLMAAAGRLETAARLAGAAEAMALAIGLVVPPGRGGTPHNWRRGLVPGSPAADLVAHAWADGRKLLPDAAIPSALAALGDPLASGEPGLDEN